MRRLKRKIAGRVWRVMLTDEQQPAAPTPSPTKPLDNTQRHPGFPGGS